MLCLCGALQRAPPISYCKYFRTIDSGVVIFALSLLWRYLVDVDRLSGTCTHRIIGETRGEKVVESL